MQHHARFSTPVVFLVACVLGVLIAAADAAAPFGDDSAKATIVLWLVSSGVLGFARPRRPWRWALSLGPWLPLTHLTRHLLGVSGAIAPNAYRTSFILLPVSVAFCLVGAYGGAMIRRLVLPPDPSAGSGPASTGLKEA